MVNNGSQHMDAAASRPPGFRVTSFSLHPHQLRWLDAKRRNGSLTRSAALRQVIDALMASEVVPAQPEHSAS